MPVAAPAPGSGGDAEPASQKAAGPAHLSRRDQLADVAAGNRFAANHHDRISLYFKSELAAKIGQASRVALGPVAKMKVFSFMHLSGPQPARQNVARKILW